LENTLNLNPKNPKKKNLLFQYFENNIDTIKFMKMQKTVMAFLEKELKKVNNLYNI
jgi:hypothetical protein